MNKKKRNKIKVISKVREFPEAPNKKLELSMTENGLRDTRKKSVFFSAMTVGLETPILLLLLVESYESALRHTGSLFH